ncbi:MAG: hypothetical protein Q4E16_03425 [Neisseria sp.]|nr:hypothetical protein [Neisseria sp.]
MSLALIRDYLQTQGLPLAADEVRAAQLAWQAVMNLGQAEIDRSLLWYEADGWALADFFSPNEANDLALKQVFMALDSCFERAEVQSASVYAVCGQDLVRLAQQGLPLEQKLTLSLENTRASLALHSAHTGWLNRVDDVAQWLEWGDLVGEHYARCASQMSVPICLESGRVLGMIHLEAAHKHAFANDEMQTAWVALAIALVQPLRILLNTEENQAENHE